MVSRRREAWLAASGFRSDARDEEIRDLLEDYVERTADEICEIVGLHHVRGEPAVRIALHGFSAFATTATRRWLLGAGLSRSRLEFLLAGTPVGLVRETIPTLLGGSHSLKRPNSEG